jgi:hypothetical protein
MKPKQNNLVLPRRRWLIKESARNYAGAQSMAEMG